MFEYVKIIWISMKKVADDIKLLSFSLYFNCVMPLVLQRTTFECASLCVIRVPVLVNNVSTWKVCVAHEQSTAHTKHLYKYILFLFAISMKDASYCVCVRFAETFISHFFSGEFFLLTRFIPVKLDKSATLMQNSNSICDLNAWAELRLGLGQEEAHTHAFASIGSMRWEDEVEMQRERE